MFMDTLQSLFWIVGIMVGFITIIERLTKDKKSNGALSSQDKRRYLILCIGS